MKSIFFNRSSKSEITILVEGKIKRKEIVLSNPEEVMELDWLLICMKEYHYPNAKKRVEKN